MELNLSELTLTSIHFNLTRQAGSTYIYVAI
jgi:hypothetical protein